jgi:ABC-type transport system substrate-binding protein
MMIEGRHDMVLSGWIADTMDPYDFLESNLASNRVPTRQKIAVANNAGRLDSKAMDEALAAFRADHDASNLERVVDLLSQEAPVVPLSYGPTAAVWSFKVKNFKPSPLSIFPFLGIDLEV